MKKIFTFLLFLISLSSVANDARWQEGEIVFQISKSSQSKYIQLATGSIYSHCGIVVNKNKQYYVLEASNIVKLTPINQWIDRGRFKYCKSYKVFDKPVHINYSKYLGQKYDKQFKFNNNKMYCSELVYLIYKEQFGIELCKPKKIKSYHLFGLSKIIKRRGINLNQLVVAPSDIINSKYLH